jgi:hypothetical protein
MILASPYIRTNSVKDLFKMHKYDLVKLRELLESEFAKQGLKDNRYLKYLDFAIYSQMKNNEEYFKDSTSLSVKIFADRFGASLKDITEKEKDIIRDVCDKIDPEREIEYIKILDETVEMVYNVENEFGPNHTLYTYIDGQIQFDNIMYLLKMDIKSINAFESELLNKCDLQVLEKAQNAIEDEIAKQGACGKACMDMCYLSDFYNKIHDKVEEIEKVMEDRNIGIDL